MTFGKRLRSRFWRGPVENEVDDELDFHVEMRTRELVARGLDPETARRTAVARFGNIDRVNATCRTIGRRRDRDMRRTEYLAELVQDVTFACRQLLKSPAFAMVAILTLALGIGATTAIFSVVHAVVLRPLPVPNPERIVAVYEVFKGGHGNVSAGNFVDGIVPVASFSDATAVRYSSFNLADQENSERVIGGRTTAGFFRVFATAPELGRVYRDDEDQPGREQVVVLSNRLWTRWFGRDRSVIGRRIRLNEQPYEVIGVMPAHFDFTDESEELWVPVAFTPERKAQHDEHYLQVYARLKPGATMGQALAELDRNAQQLRKDFPRDDRDLQMTAVGVLEDLVGDYSRRLFILLGAVGFVMLIACGNVANLLLARGATRTGELAIRAALGAGRGRIVRQLLTESVVLALVSAAGGLALAFWGIQALVAAAPPGVPRLDQTSLDFRVLGFTLAIAVASAIIFGLAPALRAARTDVQAVLKAGRGASSGSVRDWLRTTLIVTELALALLLLVGAGLLVRSSLALQRVNVGFDLEGVFSARLSLPTAEYADRERAGLTFKRLAEAAGAVPGVTSAAVTSQVPMGGGGNGNGLVPEGKTPDAKSIIFSRLRIVTPRYFETMRIPLIKGRALTVDDRRGAMKVMVVSQALADAAFPGQDPIGRRIACCESGPDGKSPDYKTVVGVVGDVRSRGPGEAPSPEFYLPIDQIPAEAWDWVQRTMYVVARTERDPAGLAGGIRAAVTEVAPGVPLFNVRTMDQRLRESLATARFNTLLLTLLGGIGVVLAAVGIYSVVAYFVSRRTQEIGVRLALGATRRDVVSLIIRQAAWPVGIGVAAGIAISSGLTRVLSSQLFGVTPGDPVTYSLVALALGSIAILASLIPARRAAGVDPTRALHMN
ncbi:MAG TPA: ABC transporter permease [Vicinamibacterales bacterium]|jgi:putative ABC transport system permease protein|nr:ABC transporter permease [Vicinamibacterales bacterium]